jgi:hypothetical protein
MKEEIRPANLYVIAIQSKLNRQLCSCQNITRARLEFQSGQYIPGKERQEEMKTIQTPIMAGITDCEIKHQKCQFSGVQFPKGIISSNSCGIAWPVLGLITILIAFIGSEP